jgi:hypothetical protein
MEYFGLLVIVIIITLLWFVNYQNHCQNQKIEKLNDQVNELIYALRAPPGKPGAYERSAYLRTYLI